MGFNYIDKFVIKHHVLPCLTFEELVKVRLVDKFFNSISYLLVISDHKYGFYQTRKYHIERLDKYGPNRVRKMQMERRKCKWNEGNR